MALELSMQALNLDGEVIMAPFTFASTTYVIVRNRLTPIALHISKRILTLPLYADLLIKDVDRICDIILSYKK